MNVVDLGVLDAPLALFGGPYSNFQATTAFFDALGAHGVLAEHAICTGDVVAYCASPHDTIAAIRRSGCVVVAGNCEKQLARRMADCGCGFRSGSACDLLSVSWYAHADRNVTNADRDWMRLCPDVVVFRHQGARYAAIHGGLSDISRFIWSISPDKDLLHEISEIEHSVGPVDTVIAGHSGLPFQRKVSGVRWINAGAIGMPPNDGRQMTRFAILDGGEVTFHTLVYDVEGAVSAMTDAGLVQGYERSQKTGYWPSEDVLPPDLRAPSLARG